jgi:hypothetical protein
MKRILPIVMGPPLVMGLPLVNGNAPWRSTAGKVSHAIPAGFRGHNT